MILKVLADKTYSNDQNGAERLAGSRTAAPWFFCKESRNCCQVGSSGNEWPASWKCSGCPYPVCDIYGLSAIRWILLRQFFLSSICKNISARQGGSLMRLDVTLEPERTRYRIIGVFKTRVHGSDSMSPSLAHRLEKI